MVKRITGILVVTLISDIPICAAKQIPKWRDWCFQKAVFDDSDDPQAKAFYFLFSLTSDTRCQDGRSAPQLLNFAPANAPAKTPLVYSKQESPNKGSVRQLCHFKERCQAWPLRVV